MKAAILYLQNASSRIMSSETSSLHRLNILGISGFRSAETKMNTMHHAIIDAKQLTASFSKFNANNSFSIRIHIENYWTSDGAEGIANYDASLRKKNLLNSIIFTNFKSLFWLSVSLLCRVIFGFLQSHQQLYSCWDRQWWRASMVNGAR